MKMKLVTIQSAHYEESIRFYEEAAGLSIQAVIGGPGQHTITMLGEDNEGLLVEIIKAEGESFHGSGISMGFAVDDVESYRAILEEKGYMPTPMISPNPHVKFFFVRDPDGMMVQFINM